MAPTKEEIMKQKEELAAHNDTLNSLLGKETDKNRELVEELKMLKNQMVEANKIKEHNMMLEQQLAEAKKQSASPPENLVDPNEALTAELAEVKKQHAETLEKLAALQNRKTAVSPEHSLAAEQNSALAKELAEAKSSLAAEQAKLAAHLPKSEDSLPSKTKLSKIQLHSFNPNKPELWFKQLDGLFKMNNVTTEEDKYFLLTTKLEARWAGEIEDLINTPPEKQPYSVVRTELINRVAESDKQRVRQLLAGAEMGDSTPSQFLRKLKSLAGPTFTNDVMFRELWLQRLPDNIQAILAVQPDSTLTEDLAKMADRIMEVHPTGIRPSVCSAQAPAMLAPTPSVTAINRSLETTDLLIDAIKDLKKEIADLKAETRRSRSKSPSNSYSRFRGTSRNRNPDGPCHFHKKFGNKAWRCQSPCNFSASSPTNANGSQ